MSRSPLHDGGSRGVGFRPGLQVRLANAVPCVTPPSHKPALSQPQHRGAPGPVGKQAQHGRMLCSKALSAMKGYSPVSRDEAEHVPLWLQACFARLAQTTERAPEGPEPTLTERPRSRGTGRTVQGKASRSILPRLPDVVQRPRPQPPRLEPPESPTDDWIRGVLQWSTPVGMGSSPGAFRGSELGTRTGSGLGTTIRSVSGVSIPILSLVVVHRTLDLKRLSSHRPMITEPGNLADCRELTMVHDIMWTTQVHLREMAAIRAGGNLGLLTFPY